MKDKDKKNRTETIQKILYWYNIEAISQQANLNIEITRKAIEAQKNKLTIPYILNQGICIPILFGYHLSVKLHDNTISKIGRKKYVFAVNLNDFRKLLKEVWPDIGIHQQCLEVIWNLFKDHITQSLSLRQLDKFLDLCTQQINQYSAMILQNVPQHKINKIIKIIQQIADQQDLHNTKKIDKRIIQQIFQQQVNLKIQFDPVIIDGVKIKYNKFIQKFMKAGIKIKQYLLGIPARKITRFIRLISNKNKNIKKQKKGSKQSTGRQSNRKGTSRTKQTISNKYIKQLIQSKKHLKQQNNKIAIYFTKKIIQQLIYQAVQIYQHMFPTTTQTKNIYKYIYITQPYLGQIQIQKNNHLQVLRKGWSNTVIIINQSGISQAIDIIKPQKLKSFQIKQSNIFKKSKIIDFQIYETKIIILKQNGLLCSWQKSQNSYNKFIQTSYKNIISIHQIKKNILTIYQGIIFINCTTNYSSKIQLYCIQKLQYLGCIQLNKLQYYQDYSIIQQAQHYSRIYKNLNIDKIINFQQYKQIMKDYDSQQFKLGKILYKKNNTWQINNINQQIKWILSYRHNNLIPINEQLYEQLMKMQYSYYQFLKKQKQKKQLQQIKLLKYKQQQQNKKYNQKKKIKFQIQKKNINKLQNNNNQQYIHMMIIIKLKNNNKNKNQKKIIKLKNNKNNININIYMICMDNKYKKFKKIKKQQNIIHNIILINIIKRQQNIYQKFIYFQEFHRQQFVCIKTEDRKKFILTLYEDYNLQSLKNSVISRKQLIKWLQPCYLSQQQLKYLMDRCIYTPTGQIDMKLIINNQYYQAINQYRNNLQNINNLNLSKRKILEFPSVIIKYMIPIPAIGLILIVLQFPYSHAIHVIRIVDGKLINTILINDPKYIPKTLPNLYYCSQTGYIISTLQNTLQIWKSSQICQLNCKPIRNLKLGNQAIVNSQILYSSNTLLTLSKTYLKIWDLKQIQQSLDKKQRNFYRLKAGYYAQSYQKTQYQITQKKKIPIHGQSIEIKSTRTIDGYQIISVLSSNSQKYFIKIFHLNKYQLLIKQQKKYQQIPTKLIKQLQKMANQNRYILNKPYLQQNNNVKEVYYKFIQIYKGQIQKYQNKDKENHGEYIHKNYLLAIIADNIIDFLRKSKQENITVILSKWILAMYQIPLGSKILQILFDLTSMDKYKIIDLLSKQKNQLSLAFSPKNQIKNQILIKQNCKMIDKFHKKYRFQQIKVKLYAQSLAQSLLLQQLLLQCQIVHKNIFQLLILLKKQKSKRIPISYTIQSQIQLSINQQNWQPYQKFNKLQQHIILSSQIYQYNQYITKQQSITDQYTFQKIILHQQDIKCKSGGKFLLNQFVQLYQDQNISNSYLIKHSQRQLITIHKKQYIPVTHIIINKQCELSQKLSFLIEILSLLSYCQQKYSITGLLIDLQNIQLLRNQNNIYKCKFKHFYQVIKVDSDGNYIQGNDIQFSIKYNSQKFWSPQIYRHIYTSSYDIYQLGKLIFYLITGQNQYQQNQYQQNKQLCILKQQQQSQWLIYNSIHQKCRNILINQQYKLKVQQKMIFSLIYDCTKYQWYQRPKLKYIWSTVTNIIDIIKQNQNRQIYTIKNIFMPINIPQIILKRFSQIQNNHQYQQIEYIIKKYQKYNYKWTLNNLIQYRSIMKNKQLNLSKYYQLYNKLLKIYLIQDLPNTDTNIHQIYLNNAVDYGFDPEPTDILLCHLSKTIYNQIINNQQIKKYMQWCDQQWKIQQFNIFKKIQQLNMKNRINILPKSSSYYKDIFLLLQWRIQLFEPKKNKQQTNKKMVISFIYTSVISNNVNKISAIKKSNLIKYLYKFIQHQQIGNKVQQLLNIITQTYQPQVKQTIKTVDQAYKVMMIIYYILDFNKKNYQKQIIANNSKIDNIKDNISKSNYSNKKINLSKSVNKQQQPAVDILTFLNDYYSLGGQECKRSVLKQICKQQISNNLILLITLSSIKHNPIIQQILINLTYDIQTSKILASPIIQTYSTRLNVKKPLQSSLKMKKILQSHQCKISLLELSSTLLTKKSLHQLIQQHIFYYQKIIKQNKSQLTLSHLYNFYQHYIIFLQSTQKYCIQQINNSQSKDSSLKVIQNIIHLHYILHQIYTDNNRTYKIISKAVKFNTIQLHVIKIITFLMELMQSIYKIQPMYRPNRLLYNPQSMKQPIKQLFTLHQKIIQNNTDLMVEIGYIHYYLRIVRRQHQLMTKYIQKGVQNIHIGGIYAIQAQYRLNSLYCLLNDKKNQIHRVAVEAGVGKYIIEEMLNCSIKLDLRYYKITDQAVPYRLCHPLRAQAITMIGFILPMEQSPLRMDLCSKLIPTLQLQKQKLSIIPTQPQIQISWVQCLWLFANILSSGQERLKYEFISIGLYQIVINLLSMYPMLNIFFPTMSQTIKSGTLLSSSIVLSRSMGLWK